MTILHSKVWIWGLLVLLISACLLSLQTIPHQRASSQDHILEILAKLQSRDASDLAEARAELAATGDEAIEPLIHLLRSLTTEDNNTFRVLPAEEQDRQSLSKNNGQALDLATKSRVMNDIYEALGRLHAIQAVPLLISIMENEEINDMIQGMSPVMRALAEIGPEAVPQVTECIDNARNTALASASLQGPDLSDETRKRRLDLIEGRIQMRALLVLRKIGDKRAISSLEKVEATTDNQFIRGQAREALQAIRKQ